MRKITAKLSASIVLVLLLSIALVSQLAPRSSSSTPQTGGTDRERMLANLGDMPVRFEPNMGQAPDGVQYLARTSDFTLFLSANEILFSLTSRPGDGGLLPVPKTTTLSTDDTASDGTTATTSALVSYSLLGADHAAEIAPGDLLLGTSNYFTGNDSSQWRSNIPNYSGVRYKDVYPGVDMVWHGTASLLEYDFEVAPGADVAAIRFAVEGATGLEMQGDNLLLRTAAGDLRQAAPVIYQDGPQGRQTVSGGYVLSGGNELSFSVGAYDPSRALVIDPVLSYSTFLGGSGYDDGRSIAVDANGNAYVTGVTQSTNFPTQAPLQAANGGGFDVFVSKFSADGGALIYSTYLGGSGEEGDIYLEGDNAIAVDAAGNAYIAGRTASPNFPALNAFQASFAGGANDVFLTKLNPAGNALVFSTYLGGSYSDYATGVALDSVGSPYVAGVTFSLDWPTRNPFQPTKTGFQDAFLTKFTPSGDDLVYSTYLGGGTDAVATELAVDSQMSAYVGGYTGSSDFPTLNAFQATYAGNNDAFITKFTPAGNALVYSTYLGGSQTDFSFGMTVDSQRSVYITGYTQSTDFPTQNALQDANAGGFDLFITRFSEAGNTLEYSTYLGGRYWDFGFAIAVDSSRQAHVTGYAESDDFPTQNPLQPTRLGPADVVVSKLTASGDGLVYSTYLGGTQSEYGLGIAVDSLGGAYLTGDTSSSNFPTQNPQQPAFGGGTLDAFALKISDQPQITPTPQATNTTAPTSTETTAPPTSTSTTAATETATTTATSTATATVTATGAPATATVIATATACTLTFTDVPEGSTFYENIRCLACRGIINGYTTDCDTGSPCFKPGNLVTRGQLAKIVANAAGFSEPIGTQQFEDVQVGSTFFEFIWRLANRAIINGYPCGGPSEPCGAGNLPYFRPNANITRGQISKIVSEAAGFEDTPTGQQFEDVAINSTFYIYIWRLADRQIMSGYPCGGLGEPCGNPALPYFRPGANATRGQASKIVANTFYPDCQTP